MFGLDQREVRASKLVIDQIFKERESDMSIISLRYQAFGTGVCCFQPRKKE